MPLSVEEKLWKLENDPAWTTVVLPVMDSRSHTERILVETLSDGRLRVAASPGMVLGLARDDIIALDADRAEGYELNSRGGNIAVHVFFPEAISPELLGQLVASVEAIGGWLDGTMSTRGLCFTFPLASGFDGIEALCDGWASRYEGCQWFYSNVYDADGVTPLGWWVAE